MLGIKCPLIKGYVTPLLAKLQEVNFLCDDLYLTATESLKELSYQENLLTPEQQKTVTAKRVNVCSDRTIVISRAYVEERPPLEGTKSPEVVTLEDAIKQVQEDTYLDIVTTSVTSPSHSPKRLTLRNDEKKQKCLFLCLDLFSLAKSFRSQPSVAEDIGNAFFQLIDLEVGGDADVVALQYLVEVGHER